MSTNSNKEFISRSEADTEAFAADLAASLPRGSVLALSGDLGAGKTVFSRGFARGLGILEPVSSPTYTIIQEYPCPGGGWFFHMDLYRISDARSALDFGVDEYLEDPEAWSIIEWAERISGILPPQTLHLRIQILDGDARRITVG
jgi:tRNA threonylcarbamoyladenosine biosynthesis protein TsaE